MFKGLVVTLFSMSVLVACQLDEGDQPNMAEEVENISISGVSTTNTVNYSSTINLTISGSNNIVTIASNIKELKISGTNATVTVNDSIVIESITLSGTSIALSLPTGYSTNLSDSGVSNSVTYR